MGKILIFHHIQKTGGSTLRAILECIYPHNDLQFFYTGKDKKRFQALNHKERNNTKVFMGHEYFGFHRNFKKPCSYFTILREPIERTISYYCYMRLPSFPKDISTKHLSLKEFLTSGENVFFDNGMTRHLSGIVGQHGTCSSEMLEIAKDNVKQWYAAIGLLERFDESMILFKRCFGWPAVFYTRLNIGHQKMHKDEIDSETQECLEKYNKFDIQLYDWAKDYFNKRLQTFDVAFNDECALFSILNQYNAIEHPVSVADKLKMVNSLYFEGEFSKSHKMLEELLNNYPCVNTCINTDSLFLYRIASLLQRMNQLDKASEYFRRVIEITDNIYRLSGAYYHLREISHANKM
ncbi:sulfotransferase family 2 domain-containing protein [Candidatus Omnitrophota bacterium]